ncbi:COG1470 family protein [Dyadobacter luteus]|uniref:COG1470 family protein n=1 Tax=Dyadobacter luteus TaxID=2259619 RepID=UPI001E3BB305|nr:hypothetical protein [Dyadobacter luteus]
MLTITLKGFSQSQRLVVTSNSPGKVAAGGHFTLFFEVKSENPLPESLHEKISLPQRWNLLSERKPEIVSGQKVRKYMYVINTPAGAAAGGYLINFTVNAMQHPVTTPVLVMIDQVRKVDILVISQPEFTKEGDTLRVEYMVQNSGNKKEALILKSTRGYLENTKDTLMLDPGAKMTVVVAQIVPFTDANAWQSASDLSADMTDGIQPAYQAVSVPVFSAKVKKIDPYYRFPVEIGGGYLSYVYGNRSDVAFQYSALGRGFVDQKQKHYLDFTLRGPNQFVFPAVGSYDQYSLDYAYKNQTFVSVGDYVMQLNNLMEFGRFGRGLRLEQQFKRISYTAFYQKARFFPNQRDAAGGKILFKLGQASNVGLHYASKNVAYFRQQFWSNMLGVSANIHTKDIQLEAEAASGQARGITDYGGFLRFQLSKKWISLSSNVIYAGKDFYGFYNNSRLLNLNLGLNITQKLTVGLGSNFSDVNPGLDATSYSISPKDRSYLAYISYLPNQKNRFFVFYSTQQREDRLKPIDFHYWEEFGNLSYNYTSEKFSVFYQGRYGHSKNLLIADNTGKRQFFSNLIQPTIRTTKWLWLGGYLEHQHTSKFSSADIIQDLFFYGGNARISLKKNLQASFMYRNNYAPDELYERRSYLDLSILLDLKRHRFSLTGGRTYVPNLDTRDKNTLFLTMKYALKLNIPVSRKRNLGSLKGKLTGFGFPKQGNLIQLGSHRFMTDSTGMFSFEGVAPDNYYLSITQNEARGEGVIPVVKMPMLVEVKADSIKVVEIPLSRTGNILGKVEFVKPSQNGVLAVLKEKPMVLVKMSDEMTSLITEVNEKGEFSFKEIRPGSWNISAYIPGNQDRFIIDDSDKRVDLDIDKTINIVFKLRPNERRIHFSNKNFEVSVKK